MATFGLRLHPEELVVCRLDADADAPAVGPAGFHAIVRTADELSIVCASAAAPVGARVEGPWRAFEVVGPLDFSMVGVLAELSRALADAEVSVFVISTFDTDWLLVPGADVGRAQWAFETHGHTVAPAPEPGRGASAGRESAAPDARP